MYGSLLPHDGQSVLKVHIGLDRTYVTRIGSSNYPTHSPTQTHPPRLPRPTCLAPAACPTCPAPPALPRLPCPACPTWTDLISKDVFSLHFISLSQTHLLYMHGVSTGWILYTHDSHYHKQCPHTINRITPLCNSSTTTIHLYLLQ